MQVRRPVYWRQGGLVLSSLDFVRTFMETLIAYRRNNRSRVQYGAYELLDEFMQQLQEHFAPRRPKRASVKDFSYEFSALPEDHVFYDLVLTVERIPQGWRRSRSIYLLSIGDVGQEGEDLTSTLALVTQHFRATFAGSLSIVGEVSGPAFLLDFDDIMGYLSAFPWYKPGVEVADYFMIDAISPRRQQGDRRFWLDLQTDGDVRVSLGLVPHTFGDPTSWQQDGPVIYGPAVHTQGGYELPTVLIEVTPQRAPGQPERPALDQAGADKLVTTMSDIVTAMPA